MKITRLQVLLLVFFALAGIWLLREWIFPSVPHEEATYSLIEEGLYMGGSVTKPPPETRAVLNLCEQKDTYHVEVSRWESIPDAEPAPDLDWLRRMVAFVNEHRRAGRTTYVHCAAGISRSGMVVTAYLMAKHGWTRDQTLDFIRTKRSQVSPNPAFMERLLEWEKELQIPQPK